MLVLKASESNVAYEFAICLNPEAPKAKRIVKTFVWGKDQDIEVSKLEMKRLCELELQQMQATTLPDEGEAL